MNVQVSHVVVHTPEQVREIVSEAIVIADGAAAENAVWDLVFTEACRLLGQRFTLAAQPQQVPLDLSHLSPVGGRH